MTRARKILVSSIALLNCVNVAKVGYFVYVIATSYKDLSTQDLALTIFIHFAILFFAAVLALGVAKTRESLLIIWLAFSALEILRSSLLVYATVMDPHEDSRFEIIFNSFDLATQILLTILVTIFLKVIKDSKKSRLQISSIGRSIALSQLTINTTV